MSLPSLVLVACRLSYLVADQAGLISKSEGVAQILGPIVGQSLYDLLPELVGMERIIADISAGRLDRFELPWVNRGQLDEGVQYIDLILLPAEGPSGDLLVVIADSTPVGRLHQQLAQQRNELAIARGILRQHNDSLTQSNERLDLLQRELQGVLDHLRVATAAITLDGQISYVSAAARHLFLNADSAVGKPWSALASWRSSDKKLLQAAFEQPAGAREKVEISVEDGRGRHVRLEVEIVDQSPEDGWYLFFYDVSEVHGLRSMLSEPIDFHGLIGRSESMCEVFDHIQNIAQFDSTVLVLGETGTGKELVAKALHRCSHRADKPFIAVNCAGLTDSLLSSQLFGHRKGSFTGAVENQAGIFEVADGGTLFLDEIGDIPMRVQTNLLRVLQEREYTRVGDSTPRKTDVRVITATNQDLKRAVKEGRFRADLLYRIRIARIEMPPLRERIEDIPLLADHLLAQLSARTRKRVTHISHAAMGLLMSHEWPGNVRELHGVLEAAFIQTRGTVIEPSDLPSEIRAVQPQTPVHDSTSDRIRAALKQVNGNRTRAAQLLGISRATLYRRLTDLSIE